MTIRKVPSGYARIYGFDRDIIVEFGTGRQQRQSRVLIDGQSVVESTQLDIARFGRKVIVPLVGGGRFLVDQDLHPDLNGLFQTGMTGRRAEIEIESRIKREGDRVTGTFTRFAREVEADQFTRPLLKMNEFRFSARKIPGFR
jgi:hypothetical protein